VRGGNSARPGRAIKADALQCQVDFLQRLLAKIGDPQQIVAGAFQQIFDGEDPALFETVRGANRESDFGGTHFKSRLPFFEFFVLTAEWNSSRCHEQPSLMISNRVENPREQHFFPRCRHVGHPIDQIILRGGRARKNVARA